MKVLIDAGHGGKDYGACFNGYNEKDLNLKVSELLEVELKRCGIDVTMTRCDDTFLEVVDRGVLARQINADCILSIHFNANDTTSKGSEFIHSLNNESAKWIALCIAGEVAGLGTYKRGVWTKESSSSKGHNYYGVLRGAEPIAGVICEGLFLDNKDDIKFLQDVNFLKKLAIAYAKGLCKAYSITYVSESAPIKETSVEEILKSAELDNWEIWENAKNAAIAMAVENSNVGDLEPLKYLDAFIKKIYKAGQKHPA